MSVERLIGNLLRIAQEDIEGARLLASQGNRNAIYLCEQAAEKVIRAVLTSEGRHAGTRHQLKDMVDLVPDENPLKPVFRAVQPLAAYATAYRYPTVVGRVPAPPGHEVLEKAIADLEALLAAAAQRFQVDLSKPDTPARASGPIR